VAGFWGHKKQPGRRTPSVSCASYPNVPQKKKKKKKKKGMQCMPDAIAVISVIGVKSAAYT
jgi:hypothetical protein